ncbi:SGNH/GDSL hydrolase family protein [Streptomyces sp. Je 1-369]|uniref:SGNH/GDSL hydrolase family protein n=1 Tax=Streptomyces sp. Je 1-369 TaxID=2966192 RepID=UPI002285C624|nr:SGNH/GDSL hydrolase family protein [Streptomyces sp. Je 1-369]WAL93409.1 SGNH/GDSL hydrolase family protein [Streptomyces sp. Je 1-369]
MPRPQRTVAALAAVTGIAALGLGAGPAAAAPATSDPLRYVALGDSYSAGSGVLPLDPKAPLLCARTSLNYPHLLAASLGAHLTDVTCGGAQTKHFTTSQYPGVAPQFDALKSDTELVTLTIGGNDNSTFINAILACGSAGILSGGKGSPCKDLHGDKFKDQIDATTYPAIKNSLNQIRAKSPKAKVAILGYPWITPAKAVPGCFAKMPLADGDVPYLRDLQAHLNGAAQRAAAETGTAYVDMAAVSEAHDACRPAGQRWIEPVLFGTNFVPVHPNALGEAGMAKQTAAALKLS